MDAAKTKIQVIIHFYCNCKFLLFTANNQDRLLASSQYGKTPIQIEQKTNHIIGLDRKSHFIIIMMGSPPNNTDLKRQPSCYSRDCGWGKKERVIHFRPSQTLQDFAQAKHFTSHKTTKKYTRTKHNYLLRKDLLLRRDTPLTCSVTVSPVIRKQKYLTKQNQNK